MELRLLAGHPVLDFVNTIDPREGPDQVEHLTGFNDLVQWAQRAGVLNADEARKAVREASGDARSSSRAFGRAIALRESLYGVFSAIAGRSPVPSEDVSELQLAYREAIAHSSLIGTGG